MHKISIFCLVFLFALSGCIDLDRDDSGSSPPDQNYSGTYSGSIATSGAAVTRLVVFHDYGTNTTSAAQATASDNLGSRYVGTVSGNGIVLEGEKEGMFSTIRATFSGDAMSGTWRESGGFKSNFTLNK